MPALAVKSLVGEGRSTDLESFSYLSSSGTVYSVTVYVLPFDVEVGRSFTVKVPFASVFLMVLNFTASTAKRETRATKVTKVTKAKRETRVKKVTREMQVRTAAVRDIFTERQTLREQY